MPNSALRALSALILAGCAGSPSLPTKSPNEAPRVLVLARTARGHEAPREAVDVAPRVDADPKLEAARVKLDEARRLYRDLQLPEALEKVGEAQSTLAACTYDKHTVTALIESHVLAATYQLAMGQPEAARASMSAAVALRPEASLDEAAHPPNVRTLHLELKRALRTREVALRVTTDPTSAALEIDGVPMGVAPSVLRAFAGRHLLRARAVGFLDRSVAVQANADRDVTLTLEPAPKDVVLGQLAASDALTVSRSSSTVRRHIARTVGVDSVVWLHPTNEGWEAMRVRLGDGELETARTTGKGRDDATRVVGRVRTGVSSDDEEDEDSVWSSPWLWVGVGAAVVVAGATTAAILLTQDPETTLVVNPSP